MSGDNGTKRILAIAGAFTVLTGGSLLGAFFTGYDTFKQVDVNTIAIAERITVNTFKRYTLTSDLEDAKAKLSQFNEMDSLTLNQQAEVNYLTNAITRWTTKLNELDDE